MTLPVHVYQHLGGACSITGGYVYRGSAYPALQGIYFYTDYCTGLISGLQRDNGTFVSHDFPGATSSITSFGQDESGELYLTTRNGNVYQIVTP
jgi:hypothetical protein